MIKQTFFHEWVNGEAEIPNSSYYESHCNYQAIYVNMWIPKPNLIDVIKLKSRKLLDSYRTIVKSAIIGGIVEIRINILA